jgi:nucleoid-associated protein YgaU
MGLFDFVKDVGKKLGLGGDSPEITEDVLVNELNQYGLEVKDLTLTINNGVVNVGGTVSSQEVREKAILALGNVNGISQIYDNITVEESKPESQFYTVKRGDSLSKISKEYYGNAMKYMVIFDANKPMLSDPDKIYPGQVLRIPDLED